MKKPIIILEFSETLHAKFTSKATINTYLNVGNNFIYDNHPDSIDKLTKGYIQTYLLSIKIKKSASSYNQYLSALKILYRDVFDQNYKLREIKPIKVKRKLKNLPSFKDVSSKLDNIKNIKHKAIILTIISTGVRMSELLNIKIQDVDSENNRILIIEGKGGKSRFVPLTEELLYLLRLYYKSYKPKCYLFEYKDKQYSKSSVSKVIKNKLDKNAHAHLYRHLFATYMINKGVNHFKLKELLGHESERSTAWYYQYDNNNIETNINPINEFFT
jgi:integrase